MQSSSESQKCWDLRAVQRNGTYSRRTRHLYKDWSFSYLWEPGNQITSFHSRFKKRRKIEKVGRKSNCTLSHNASSVSKSFGQVSLQDIMLEEWSVTILNISALALYFHSWISHVTFVALSHCIALLKSEEVRKNLFI